MIMQRRSTNASMDKFIIRGSGLKRIGRTVVVTFYPLSPGISSSAAVENWKCPHHPLAQQERLAGNEGVRWRQQVQ